MKKNFILNTTRRREPPETIQRRRCHALAHGAVVVTGDHAVQRLNQRIVLVKLVNVKAHKVRAPCANHDTRK